LEKKWRLLLYRLCHFYLEGGKDFEIPISETPILFEWFERGIKVLVNLTILVWAVIWRLSV